MILSEKYIDFHTHTPTRNSDIFEIVSVDFNEIIETDFFTLGRHPWWSESVLTSDEKQQFVNIATQENCLGIGEIGLDKLKGETIEIQIEIFKQQLKIAEELQKSVIIHCVKSFDLLLNIKKEFPNIKNWCIHGFTKNTTLAKQLISNGFYLSIPPKINPTETYVAMLEQLPKEKFFLETDDSDFKIEDLYLQTSKLRGVSISELKQQLIKNLERFLK